MSAGQSHIKSYLAVFAALMALTALTVFAAHANLGSIAPLVAVAIAVVKATLVVMIFMHVKYESKLIGLYAMSGFVFLALLVVITMGEYAGRLAAPSDPLGPPTPAETIPKK